MTGKVTFVSADIKVNDNGNAYYLVETSVNPGELRNQNGEEAFLKFVNFIRCKKCGYFSKTHCIFAIA